MRGLRRAVGVDGGGAGQGRGGAGLQGDKTGGEWTLRSRRRPELLPVTFKVIKQ